MTRDRKQNGVNRVPIQNHNRATVTIPIKMTGSIQGLEVTKIMTAGRDHRKEDKIALTSIIGLVVTNTVEAAAVPRVEVHTVAKVQKSFDPSLQIGAANIKKSNMMAI